MGSKIKKWNLNNSKRQKRKKIQNCNKHIFAKDKIIIENVKIPTKPKCKMVEASKHQNRNKIGYLKYFKSKKKKYKNDKETKKLREQIKIGKKFTTSIIVNVLGFQNIYAVF